MSAAHPVIALGRTRRTAPWMIASVKSAPDASSALKQARAVMHEERSLLTKREWQVLRLVAQGLTSRQAGERLSIGVRTVETHRAKIFRKLH